ncbi:MAG: hypothetical protein KJ077_13910 [Anaerolineae bacterium]|nr:hypothetical protein [Anaerolineae bacterium]
MPENDEILAWEPLGDDLWLPERIRGSWRGGVLGRAFKTPSRAGAR